MMRSSPAIAVAALLLAAGCGSPGPGASSGGDSDGACMAVAHDMAPPASPDLFNGATAGSLAFDVTDDESGVNLPSRVLVTAVPPTPPVRFDINARGEKTNGATAAYPAPGVIGDPSGIMLSGGAGSVGLLAGSYDLLISHGPEWEVDTRRVVVTAGAATPVKARLRHSVDTRGWMSADLHVHTLRSYDSKLQIDSRVVSEVSVGVQLIVTTDHNLFTDIQPDLEAFGYTNVARSFIGDEFNFVPGHGGAYPMTYDPCGKDPGGLLDGGAAALKLDWGHTMSWHSRDIFDYLHSLPTHPAVTVNHPRLLPDLGYFTNLGWRPPAAPPDAGRFDALEVLSGYMQTSEDLAALLRDWFFYLNNGVRLTGLGSSDTHQLFNTRAGFPRTWLRMPVDQPAKVLGSDLAEAIKQGRALASNGPFVLLTVDGAQLGDQIKNLKGSATVEVTVDAPGWISVDKLRIFVNGRVAVERDLTTGTRPLFHDSFPLKLPAGDAWVAAQVGGSKPLPEALVGEHSNGRALPFAITNPIYIDGDGDGQFKPAFAHLADADPGPVAPLGRAIDSDPWPLGDGLSARQNLGIPQDCEPPLWTDPRTYGGR